ncbi:hypothetical protein ACHAXT_004099 [Thalassiosira profunda]
MLWVAPLCAVAAAGLLRASAPSHAASPVSGRPQLVEDASRKHRQHQDGESAATPPTLYYFGVGSNMLKSKIVGRGINGTKIEVASMRPAFVRDHRLAFNMKGFAPLEPGMGSIEPITGESDSGALLSYRNENDGCYECHGALVELTVDNYNKVMASEGVGIDRSTIGSGFSDRKEDTGYEEVAVSAIPYGNGKHKEAQQQPIQAIALRAKPGSRLKKDPCPSRRYMSILRDGAAELQLKPCYQDFLQQHPTQYNPRWLQRIAIYNMMGSFPLFSQVPRLSFLRSLQTSLLWAVYVPTASGGNGKPSLLQTSRQFGSHVASAMCMAPLALAGAAYKHLWTRLPGKEMSPMLLRFVGVLDADDDTSGGKQS